MRWHRPVWRLAGAGESPRRPLRDHSDALRFATFGLALTLLTASAAVVAAQPGPRGERGGVTGGPPSTGPGPGAGGRGGAGPERSGPSQGRAFQGQGPGRPDRAERPGRGDGGPQIRRSEPRQDRIDRGARRGERVDRGERRVREGAGQRTNRGERQGRAERREQQRRSRADRERQQRLNRAERREQQRTNRRARDGTTPRGRQAEPGTRQQFTGERRERGDRPETNRRPGAPQVGDRPANRPGAGERTGDGQQGERRAPRLTDEQRQRIRDRFREQRSAFRHHTNVNVRIRPGRKALRSWAYYPVPAFLVEVVPWFSDYRVAWVEEQYVIVDPGSYEIVAYVEADTGRVVTERGTTYASPGREACTNVNLTGEQRQAIRAAIADGPRIELPDAEVGIDLPDRVELRTFPGEVRSQVRRIDACRYVLLNDNRIAVVAPRSREIVLIIE